MNCTHSYEGACFTHRSIQQTEARNFLQGTDFALRSSTSSFFSTYLVRKDDWIHAEHGIIWCCPPFEVYGVVGPRGRAIMELQPTSTLSLGDHSETINYPAMAKKPLLSH